MGRLALLLLMARVFADDTHDILAADDLAAFTNSFNGGSDFHGTRDSDFRWLFSGYDDDDYCGLFEVVGRHLRRDFVAGKDAYEGHSHLSRNVNETQEPMRNSTRGIPRGKNSTTFLVISITSFVEMSRPQVHLLSREPCAQNGQKEARRL